MADPKPTSNPDWAQSAATGDVSEPTASRSAGYQFEQDIAHDEVNWQFKTIGEWLRWIEDDTTVFTSVKDAIENAATGDRVRILDAYDGNEFTLEEQASWALPAEIERLDTDGRWLVAATDAGGDGKFQAFPIDDPTSATKTFAKSNAIAGTSAVLIVGAPTDADTVVVGAYGNYVEAWNLDTGASLWSYNHGAAVHDIDFTWSLNGSALVLLAGADGPSQGRALKAGDGTAAWSFSTGTATDTLSSVTYDDEYAYFGAETSAGERLFKVHLDSGTDQALNFAFSTDVDRRSMAFDGENLYVQSSVGNLAIVDRFTGDTLHSRTAPGLYLFDIDDKYLYTRGVTGTGDRTLRMVDKKTLGIVAEFDTGASTTMSACTDGYAVYVGGLDIGSNLREICRLNRGEQEKAFIRVDHNRQRNHYQRLLIPSE